MQQDEQWPIAGLDVMQALTADVGVALADLDRPVRHEDAERVSEPLRRDRDRTTFRRVLFHLRPHDFSSWELAWYLDDGTLRLRWHQW